MPRPKPGNRTAPHAHFRPSYSCNQELDELEHALAACVHLLKPGGILAVVSFHSLEDRIVKQFMAGRAAQSARLATNLTEAYSPPLFALVTGKPVLPSSEEEQANPGSFSKIAGGQAHRCATTSYEMRFVMIRLVLAICVVLGGSGTVLYMSKQTVDSRFENFAVCKKKYQ